MTEPEERKIMKDEEIIGELEEVIRLLKTGNDNNRLEAEEIIENVLREMRGEEKKPTGLGDMS